MHIHYFHLTMNSRKQYSFWVIIILSHWFNLAWLWLKPKRKMTLSKRDFPQVFSPLIYVICFSTYICTEYKKVTIFLVWNLLTENGEFVLQNEHCFIEKSSRNRSLFCQHIRLRFCLKSLFHYIGLLYESHWTIFYN